MEKNPISSCLPYTSAGEFPDTKQGMYTSDSPASAEPEVVVGVSSVSHFVDLDGERNLACKAD